MSVKKYLCGILSARCGLEISGAGRRTSSAQGEEAVVNNLVDSGLNAHTALAVVGTNASGRSQSPIHNAKVKMQRVLRLPRVAMAALLLVGVQGATAAPSKTAFVGTSTTPATSVAAGSTVKFVIDLGNNTTIPTPTEILTTYDTLAAGLTSPSVPQLPAGWSSPVAPVPGTATTAGVTTAIAKWLAANNQPSLGATSAFTTAVPLPEANAYQGAGALFASQTSVGGTGSGDGLYPFVYTNSAGVITAISVNHHASNPSVACLTFPAMSTSCTTSLTNFATFTDFHYARIGDKVYVPGYIGTAINGAYNFGYACIDISGVTPVQCATVDTGRLGSEVAGQAYAVATNSFVPGSAYSSGNKLITIGADALSTVFGGDNKTTGLAIYTTDATTGATTKQTIIASGAGGFYAANQGSFYSIDNPDDTSRKVWFSAIVGGVPKAMCVNISGGVVSDCATGSTTTFTQVTSAGGEVTPFTDAAGNVIGVCYNRNMNSCFDGSLNPTTAHSSVLNNLTSINAGNAFVVPGTDIVLDSGYSYGGGRCVHSSTGGGLCTNQITPIVSYGWDLLFSYNSTQKCVISYGDTSRWTLWTVTNGGPNDGIVAGCASPAQVKVTFPDPAPQHCGPNTSVITWGNLIVGSGGSTLPTSSANTATFYDANGVQIGAPVTFSSTAGTPATVPIEPTVPYSANKTFSVQVLPGGSLTTGMILPVLATHNTSDGSGPQICFTATIPATCPAGTLAPSPTVSLNTFYASASSTTALNVGTAASPINTTTSTTSSSLVTCIPSPALALTKSATPSTGFKVGAPNQSYTVTLVVTNGPTTAVTTIADPLPTGITTSGPATMAVTNGGTSAATLSGCSTAGLSTLSCTLPTGLANGTYTITVPISVGSTAVAGATGGTNTATASGGGTSCDGSATQPTSCVGTVIVPVIALVGTPKLAVTKVAGVPTIALGANNTITDVGDQIAYTFMLTNTGDTPLYNATVNDPRLSGLTCTPVATLAVGASATLTCSNNVYTLLPADITNGSVLNTATGNATAPDTSCSVPPCIVTGIGKGTANVPTTNSNSGITVTKLGTPAVITAAGTTINYTILVDNTGPNVLTNVLVTDPKITNGSLTCPGGNPIATLAVGASVVCTASYVATSTDVLNGAVNVATATGTAPASSCATPPCTVTDSGMSVVDPASNKPELKVVKSASPSQITKVGEIVDYTIVTSNSGNVPLTNVGVTDDKVSNLTCTANGAAVTLPWAGPLAVGQSITCVGTYVTNAADVAAGKIVNTATGTGTAPASSCLTPPCTLTNIGTNTIPVTTKTLSGSPTLTVTKIAGVPTSNLGSNSTKTDAGDTVTYTFSVTNSGSTPLSNVTIADPMLPALNCTAIPTLAVGATQAMTCTGNVYTLTATDIARGDVLNTVTGTGTAPDSACATPPCTVSGIGKGTANVPTLSSNGDITLTKLASPSVVTAAGTVVNYTIIVANTGTSVLSNVIVTDAVATGTTVAVTCPGGNPIATLAVAQKVTCTASYVATAADVTSGIVNVATATGTAPATSCATPPCTVTGTGLNKIDPASTKPDFKVTKTSAPTVVSQVGQILEYTIVGANVGNTVLTNVSVVDSKVTGPLSCTVNGAATTMPVASLAIGQSIVCTGKYTTTAADAAAGQVVNTATGVSTAPASSCATPPCVLTNTGTNTVPMVIKTLSGSPTMSVTKIAGLPTKNLGSNTSISDAGDTVTYTFSITNTGNTVLSNVTVTDPLIPSLSCTTLTTLAVGATQALTCTNNTYTLTAADVSRGSVLNVVTANAIAPDSTCATPPCTVTGEGKGTSTVPTINTTGGLTLTKLANPATVSAVGSIINYSIKVENTGTATLTDVNVTDTLSTGTTLGVICPSGNPIASLAVGQVVYCTASHTATAADVTAGITNVAKATGTAPPLSCSVPPCTVSGTSVNVVDPVTNQPELKVTKSASPAVATAVGQVITYTLVGANTGNAILTNVSIADSKITSALTCALAGVATTLPVASMNPGQSVVCAGTYTVTAADLAAGQLVNVATGKATAPATSCATPPCSLTNTGTNTLPLTPAAAIGSATMTIIKTGGKPTVALGTNTSSTDAGDTITYTFAVQNTGTVQLYNVNVTDPKLPSLSCATIPTLAVGATQTFTCTNNTYTLTTTDINNGSVVNVATGTATAPDSSCATPPCNLTSIGTATTNLPDIARGIGVTKLANPSVVGAAGTVITYTIVVQNTGTVTLTNVNVTDATSTGTVLAVTCPGGNPIASLAANASVSCSATYTATAADVTAGINNTATAVGTAPATSCSTPPCTITGVGTNKVDPSTARPELKVLKTASLQTVTAVGQSITYTIVASNTGNVALTSVNVTDNKITGALSCTNRGSAVTLPIATLAIGDSVTCTGTYVATAADQAAGQIVNTATGTAVAPSYTCATPPCNLRSTGTSVVTAPAPAIGSATMTIIKTGGKPTVALGTNTSNTDAGDTITYTFAVQNTGTVQLTNVNVTDPKLPNLSCTTIPTLAVGATQTFTCTNNIYTLTTTDINNGSVVNVATGTAKAPDSSCATPPCNLTSIGTATTNLPDIARGIGVTKLANPSVVGAAGTVITYTIVVQNTGTVTLTNVNVTDATSTGTVLAVTCPGGNPIASLAANASVSCSATYTATAADVTAGINNTATAVGTAPATSCSTPPCTITGVGTNKVDPSTARPELKVLKTASLQTVTAVGQSITYTIVASNTGNVALTSVNVTDNKITGALSCTNRGSAVTLPIATLAIGDSVTCTGTYVATAADQAAGQIVNTATGTAVAPSYTCATAPCNLRSTGTSVVTAPAPVIVAPVAKPDSGTTPVNTPVTVSTPVLTNDTGNSIKVTNLIGLNGQTCTAPMNIETLEGDRAKAGSSCIINGVAGKTCTVATTNGSVTMCQDGTYTYTPNANYVGTDSFFYTIADSTGQTAAAAVNLTVTGTAALPDVITKVTAPTSLLVPGTPATATVQVGNIGTVVANNVVTTLQMPAGLSGVTVSNGGTYNAATGLVTWPAIASIAANTPTAATYTVSYNSPGVPSATLTSNASLVSGSEVTLANNPSSLTLASNTEVPTLSEWMLMLLMMMVASLAMNGVRKTGKREGAN